MTTRWDPSVYTEGSKPKAPLNTLAVVAFAAAWVPFGCFVAIPLGHIAKREIRRTGEAGRALATWALILGYTSILWLPMLLVVIMSIGAAQQ